MGAGHVPRVGALLRAPDPRVGRGSAFGERQKGLFLPVPHQNGSNRNQNRLQVASGLG